MHVRVNREQLADGLSLCQLSADPKSTMQVMSHVLLWCDFEGELNLATTDGNLTTRHVVRAEVGEHRGFCVEAKRFHGLVSGMDDAEVLLRQADGFVDVSCGDCAYRLPTLDGRDFPKLFDPPREMQTIEPSLLVDMLAHSQHAMSSDSSRLQYEGVQIDGDGQHVDVIACKGSVHSSWLRQPMSLKLSAHVPFKGAKLLQSMLSGRERAEIGKRDGMLFVRSGPTTIAIKLLDDFPFAPVRLVVPKALGAVRVDRATLMRAANRMLSVGVISGDSAGVELHIGRHSIVMRAESAAAGRERIEIERLHGEPYSVKAGARYILAALAAHDDEKIAIETGYRRKNPDRTTNESGLAFRGEGGVSLVAVMSGGWGEGDYHGPAEEPPRPRPSQAEPAPTSAQPKLATKRGAKKAEAQAQAAPAAPAPADPAPPASAVPPALLERAESLGRLDAEHGRPQVLVGNAVAILVGGQALAMSEAWPDLLDAYSRGYEGQRAA